MEERLSWKITREELRKIYRTFDKLTGTVEPSYRVLHFFYRDGLTLFATDGVAKLEFLASEMPSFDGIYSIPLNDLKVVLQGQRNEQITFEFSGKNVNIFTESEFLQVRNAQRSDFPFHVSNGFEDICRVFLTSFQESLDFASVVLEEPENAGFVIFDNAMYVVGISHNVGCVAKVGNTELDRLFLGEVPYVTARHLVKSLSEIQEQNRLTIGFNGDEISLTCGRFAYHVMLEPSLPRSTTRLLKLISSVNGEEMDLRELLATLKKAYTFHPRGVVRIMRARGSPDRWQVSMQIATGLYVSKIRSLGELDGVLITEVHRLRSAMMRLGNSARISHVGGSMVLSAGDKHLFLAIR
ncbi:MAG: hypothetical protein DRP27_04485 [Thermotogae bacterium]|nr:MAG: hypothetical protein DRP27_04485 [Thermotogota bacterium]